MSPDSGRRRSFADPDRTARARIRDAAIERFATEGVAATNLKDIAADAGVSTPLILHHFGSKDGLRAACDEHIAAMIREKKSAAMATGIELDPFQAIRENHDGASALGYLAKTLVDGSPHVNDLIDEIVEDAIAYTADGVENGVVRPTTRPRERAIVLVLWQIGALVLHEHAKRLLDIDLADDSAESAIRWAQLNGEILAEGVLTAEFYQQWRESAPDDDNVVSPHQYGPEETRK